MECQDVKDILNCEQDELSIYELQEGREEADDDENQEAPPRQLTTAELSEVLQTIEQWLQWFEDNDCNAESSRLATRGIRASLESYKELLYERTCVKQKNVELYFTEKNKQCEDDEELPYMLIIGALFAHTAKKDPYLRLPNG
ncbi:LOW QUALITY PROTEIN: hypothetical protein M514_17341 [Trichuris suis]|uniref:Uncharacterized protein n=1 Tax=Trichuris suis TaxID=68888 RepID=A0A085NM52_9BILA|nr:LOW QUALITY PROTEIN: hypothetical protein M514_17341 [Trichuris suis]